MLKPTILFTSLLAIAHIGLPLPASAQFQPPTPATAGAYEEPPALDTATILLPEFAQGPNFKISPVVLTYAGHNEYVIESDFGTFDATGNAQLVARVREIAAIAKLREVSRSDEYKKALEKAAQSPLLLAKGLVTDPVKTVTGVPKGIWKFMNRAGQGIKEATEKREHSPYEDPAAANLIGFSKAKRTAALQLGVDPYSSNEVLQKELNGISWATYAGSMTINLALAPVGGGAGAIITGVNVSSTAEDALRDNSPSDLRRIGLGKLLEMGIPREDAVVFLNNPAWSPTNQTLLVAALEPLRDVSNRDEFLRLASEATDETDALFFRRTAQLIAKLHAETPLDLLRTAQGLPVCLAKDGTVILALEWDYACWTQRAAAFLGSLKAGNFGDKKVTAYRVVITGVASTRAKDELTANNIRLTEKALPGPLR